MPDPLFTPAARRHIAAFIAEVAPRTAPLTRKFTADLRREGFDREQIRALLAILPLGGIALTRFPEQVHYHGRRLAKLNVDLNAIGDLLRRFDALAAQTLTDRFAPAREQLLLATVHSLNVAFYEVREAETQAFFGIYRAETQAADLDDLLRRFMGVLTRTFRARAGRIVVSLPDPPPRPLYIERGSPREALIVDPAMRGRYASYWSYPLAASGVIQFGFVTTYPWLPRELTLLDTVAARCQEAIDRARNAAEMRRLEAQAHAAEEDERRRIGRELHDEAGQSLLLLRLRLEMLERDAPADLRPRLADIRGIAENTVLELRRIISALSPAVLERLGLDRAVRQLADRFRKHHHLALRVRIALGAAEIPTRLQEVIYRVAQESLQNVAKHSQARHVNLFLRAADRRIRLSVTDDGAGFCAETAWRKPMSFGLAGMRERAALLGGTLTIRTAPGKGATVSLELPYGQDSRDVD